MPAPTPRLRPSHYQHLAALRQALRRFLRFSQEAAGTAGLTPQQHQALLAIKGFPGGGDISVGELAARLHLQPHSAVGLVDRLAQRQLVRRVRSSRDRRRVHLQLTARGERVIGRLSAVHLQELRQSGVELRRLLKSITAD
ncbi:MAG TPA: MarR family transcriptional regulator [Opitutaceae bacterium]|nr:MarR family transcriptional regulator [Opitutaceae bacterium]